MIKMKKMTNKLILEEPTDETVKTKLTESVDELGRVEFCAMDSEGNNIDCFETEEEAVEFTKDESNNVFKILRVQYAKPNDVGDEEELEAVEIWSDLTEKIIKEDSLIHDEIPLEIETAPSHFDEVSTESSDIEETESANYGIISLLNSAIIEKFESVDRLGSAIITIQDVVRNDSITDVYRDSYMKIVEILNEISNESHIHIGQLQRALELISFNAEFINSSEVEEDMFDIEKIE